MIEATRLVACNACGGGFYYILARAPVCIRTGPHASGHGPGIGIGIGIGLGFGIGFGVGLGLGLGLGLGFTA